MHFFIHEINPYVSSHIKPNGLTNACPLLWVALTHIQYLHLKFEYIKCRQSLCRHACVCVCVYVKSILASFADLTFLCFPLTLHIYLHAHSLHTNGGVRSFKALVINLLIFFFSKFPLWNQFLLIQGNCFNLGKKACVWKICIFYLLSGDLWDFFVKNFGLGKSSEELVSDDRLTSTCLRPSVEGASRILR